MLDLMMIRFHSETLLPNRCSPLAAATAQRRDSPEDNTAQLTTSIPDNPINAAMLVLFGILGITKESARAAAMLESKGYPTSWTSHLRCMPLANLLCTMGTQRSRNIARAMSQAQPAPIIPYLMVANAVLGTCTTKNRTFPYRLRRISPLANCR